MKRKNKVVLMILDGWGNGDHTLSDAIFSAKTPFIDYLTSEYPTSELLTDGENVGLPNNQMGNSEVGHLNIGSGRIVFQDLVRINKAIENDTLKDNPVLKQALETTKNNKKRSLHLFGLVSSGGIHSHRDHLGYLCKLCDEYGLENVFIHAFTDGRDCDPHSGIGFLNSLDNEIKGTCSKLVSVIGRYYAMDRDKRWDRIKIAYDMLIHGKGDRTLNVLESVEKSYNNGISDEFIKPIVKIDNEGNPEGRIQPDDVVICFNFRTDRCREITSVLNFDVKPDYEMLPLKLHYFTMTRYDEKFIGIPVFFDKPNLDNTLGEVISLNGLKQLRIAETEKYPHVTFFFSGGREKEFPGEKRILVNSPKVKTYDLKPEMSAFEVCDLLCGELKKQEMDFVCVNFANSDMVGHTGVYNAIIKAVETVDTCVNKIVNCGLENDYSFLIIADHGNSDYAINPDGTPNTAHSMNPVPFILVNKRYHQVDNGILADVAPTILSIMDLEIPEDMGGKILVS